MLYELRQEERVVALKALPPFLFAWFGCDGDVGTKTEAGGIARTAKGRFVRKSAQGDGEGAGDTGGVTAPKKKKKKPVRCIHQHTDVEFRREFPAVCKGLLRKAKAGSVRETKLLMEIGGFGDAKAAKRRDGGKSLSAMLMDELKRRQDEREATLDAVGDGRMTGESTGEGAASVSEIENA